MIYTRECYQKGTPELNLALNERKLLIKAVLRSQWNIRKALKLNFPKENITEDAYRKILAKHHISIRNKTYKKLNEIE